MNGRFSGGGIASRYVLNLDGQYQRLRADGVLIGSPMPEVAMCVAADVDGFIVHKTGDPARVRAWAETTAQALRRTGGVAVEMADSLKVIQGRFPIDTFNGALAGRQGDLQRLWADYGGEARLVEGVQVLGGGKPGSGVASRLVQAEVQDAVVISDGGEAREQFKALLKRAQELGLHLEGTGDEVGSAILFEEDQGDPSEALVSVNRWLAFSDGAIRLEVRILARQSPATGWESVAEPAISDPLAPEQAAQLVEHWALLGSEMTQRSRQAERAARRSWAEA